MHACKALPPTTSSRAFSFRYHRSGNFVVDRAQRHYRPRRAENGRRERVALLLANNAGSLADILSRPIRSRSLSLSIPSLSFSVSLVSTYTPTWSPCQRAAVFLSPHCVSQGCCLFCPSIVRIHQRIHSFRRYCLTAALSRVRSASLSANVSFHRR